VNTSDCILQNLIILHKHDQKCIIVTGWKTNKSPYHNRPNSTVCRKK